MRQTEDFLKLVDVVTRMRASGLPPEIAEAAIRAAWDDYRVRAPHDIRYIAAAERLALHPPVKEPVLAQKEAPAARPVGPPGKAQAGPANKGVVKARS